MNRRFEPYMVHHLYGYRIKVITLGFDPSNIGSIPITHAIGIIMNIFKELHYREVTETLREIKELVEIKENLASILK